MQASNITRIKMARRGKTEYFYYQNDHLGTPQQITDQQGEIVWQQTSTAFGETSVDEASLIANNLRFPGQYYDKETQTHYNFFRDYSPSIGRYLQEDPIGLWGGINVYAYVGGNPVSFVDPDGLKPLTKDCCEKLRELINFDNQQSSPLGVLYSSQYNALSMSDSILGLNCTFASIGGPVDIDWMLRTANFGYGSIMAHPIYYVMKPLWNLMNRSRFTAGMSEPGHINAPSAARFWLNSGLRLEQIFQPALNDCELLNNSYQCSE